MKSREFRSRLLERAGSVGLDVSPGVLAQLETYYRLLALWNAKINLTGIRLDEVTDQGLDRLFIEPLAASRYVPETSVEWLDVGSGGGSPALPLKLVRPAARLTMIESKTRKSAFLQEAVRSLALRDAAVENASFAEVAARPQARDSADLITVRAVKLDSHLFDGAATLLRAGGRLLLFRAGADLEPVQDARFRLGQVARVAEIHSSHIVVLYRLADLCRRS